MSWRRHRYRFVSLKTLVSYLRKLHPDWPEPEVEAQARFWCAVQRGLEREEYNADRRFRYKQDVCANPEDVVGGRHLWRFED